MDTVLSTRDGGKSRDGGTTSLLPVNGTDITDTHLDGAIAHLHEAEILRTPGNKDSLPSGLISRHLPAIARIAGERTAGKFKALFDATRSSFRIALEQATSLRQTLAGRGASVTALPDGTFRVSDAQGNEIGIAEDAEGVARIGEAHGGSSADGDDSGDGEETDRVDVIHERLSKTKEKLRDSQDDDGDYKLATAILDKITRRLIPDKKTGKVPKQVPRKALLAEKLTLTPEEQLILDSKYEILLVFSKDGRLISGKVGTRGYSDDPSAPPDATLTHNHPGGRGPSDSDITHVLRNLGRTLRIVARNEHGRIEIFQIRAKKKVGEAEITEIALRYYEVCQRNSDHHAARRKAVSLLLKESGDIIEITTVSL